MQSTLNVTETIKPLRREISEDETKLTAIEIIIRDEVNHKANSGVTFTQLKVQEAMNKNKIIDSEDFASTCGRFIKFMDENELSHGSFIFKGIELFIFTKSNVKHILNVKTNSIYNYNDEVVEQLKISYASQYLTLKGEYIHDIISFAMFGIKNKHYVDHIDGNHFNNGPNNLRYVTPSQNSQNKNGKRVNNKTTAFNITNEEIEYCELLRVGNVLKHNELDLFYVIIETSENNHMITRITFNKQNQTTQTAAYPNGCSSISYNKLMKLF